MKTMTDWALLEERSPLRVSVVVPTAGRPALLDRCLHALVRQSIDLTSFEIIVVDDAPSAETRAVVIRWLRRMLGYGLLIGYAASYGPHGPAAARNRGWRSAAAELIAFTDDDTVPGTQWLEKALQAFADPTVDAAWGRIVMPLPAEVTDYELDAQGLERAEFATANCFCRKRWLETVGGFDERFQLAWREDADLYFRLLSARARVIPLPAALVLHPLRPAPWGVCLRQQRKVMFDALLYKKHPLLYRQKIRPTPRRDYYLMVLLLATALVGAGFGQSLLAFAAGGTWLALTALFCWQRLRHTSKSPRHVAEMIVTSALIPPLAVFWRAAGALRFRVRFA